MPGYTWGVRKRAKGPSEELDVCYSAVTGTGEKEEGKSAMAPGFSFVHGDGPNPLGSEMGVQKQRDSRRLGTRYNL